MVSCLFDKEGSGNNVQSYVVRYIYHLTSWAMLSKSTFSCFRYSRNNASSSPLSNLECAIESYTAVKSLDIKGCISIHLQGKLIFTELTAVYNSFL